MEILTTKTFRKCLTAFIALNVSLYLFIYAFHDLIPFNAQNYITEYHKFYPAPQAEGKPFDFLRSLSYSDAQWYLKIAEEGYPGNLKLDQSNEKSVYSGLAYAFFPLYPLIMGFMNLPFRNIELSAFIVSNLLILANFISLYFVVSKLFSHSLALKTVFLLFLFPFSIFFRLYFTEGLFLLLLTWFGYFFVKEKYFPASVFLGLMSVTRGNGFLFFFIFLSYLTNSLLKRKIKLEKYIYSIIFSLLPLLFWMLVNFLLTADPLFFSHIQKGWFKTNLIIEPMFYNLGIILNFFNLETHLFHSSKIDVVVILLSLLILWRSKKFLGTKLWWLALILTVTPLLIKDTISFSRFQSVVFPLFIYLAHILKGYFYWIVLALSVAGLFYAGLLVVNWYWVG